MDVSNANIFISAPGQQQERSELEDWLDGRAEVSGGGFGGEWWDIDLEVPSATVPEELVQELLSFLRSRGASPDVKVRVVEYIEREYRL